MITPVTLIVVRLLIALSTIHILVGTAVSSCQYDGSASARCQDTVLVTASAQLNNAAQQINGINVIPIYDDIRDALGKLDKAAASAENLKTHAIYMSRSYQAYVTLAETLASQVGRQDCYLNYSRPIPDVFYSTACARIASAVQSYLDNLNAIRVDLLRLKVTISANPPSAQLTLLESCLSIQTSGSRSVSDCLQSYIYDYKVLVRKVTARVASDLYRVMLAEQCPDYTAMRYNVDDSVALAARDVKQYAEEVLYCAGLSARALYEQSLKEIDTFIYLYNDIVLLQENVIYEINYSANNFVIDAESVVRTYLSPIFKTLDLGLVYAAPQKRVLLKTYIANAEILIETILVNVSMELIPIREKLVAANATLGNIAKTLRHAIDNALQGVSSCLPNCIDDYFNRANELKCCFSESLYVVRSILSGIKFQFSEAVAELHPVPDGKHYLLGLIADTYAHLGNYAQTTATEILNLLDLTMDTSLTQQIVTSLMTEYANNVSELTNSIQPTKLQLQNYSQTVINSLDSDISTALKPIQNAINVILEAKPGTNVSTLNATFNQFYASLKHNLTNYINNTYLNFTHSIDFETSFNLTAQSEDLKAKLDWCISRNVNSTIGFNNLENVTRCFEPYLKNFTTLINSTLGSIRRIVDGIDNLENASQSSIATYTASAIQNATAVATNVAESLLANYNVTPNLQVQTAVDKLTAFKQAEIDSLLNYVTQLLNNVKTSNLTSLANLTSSVNASVQPWVYAVNIGIANNPGLASNLSSQYPLINQLINNTISSVYSTLTPYKQDASVIETSLKNLTPLLITTLSDYNAIALAARCSMYNTSQLQYAECLDSVTYDAKTYFTKTLLPELQGIVDKAKNLTDVANANLAATVASQLNDSNHIAKTEGGKLLSMYNVTIDTIQAKALESLKSYNITPIHNYAANVRISADRILQRSAGTLNLGNYTISTSTYVIMDAVGSASYVASWRYTFANETNLALYAVDVTRRKCLSLFPSVTQDAYDLYATAVNINTTLDYEVSLLMPSELNARCGIYMTDYYAYYQCVSDRVNNFGAYYTNALKAAWNESDRAYKLLANDTAKLNAWRDTVVAPEAVAVVESLKPIAEKMLRDYNCTADKLLGYATHIIGQRYVEYQPNITAFVAAINLSATNVLERNQSSVLDIGPSLLQLVEPLNLFIALVKNSTNQTVLTQDVLSAPSRFVANASAAFHSFQQNITTQAGVIENNTRTFVDNVEIMYRGLNYTALYNNCYNPNNTYRVIDMVVCYNKQHYAFYMYLTKVLTQVKAYYIQITDLDVNVVTVNTNYANNTLLPQFKRDVSVYTARLYQQAGLPVPDDLLPYLADRCKVDIALDGNTKCLIFY